MVNVQSQLVDKLHYFLSDKEEYIVKYLIIAANWGFLFSVIDLRLLVQNYLKRIGKK